MVFLKLQLNKLLNELLFIVHFLYNKIHPYEADFHCIKPRGTIVWTSRFDCDNYVGNLFDHGKHFTYNVSASVTSASCISDALKSLKMQSNSWHASHRTQRSIDLSI